MRRRVRRQHWVLFLHNALAYTRSTSCSPTPVHRRASCICTRLCPSRGPFSRDFSLTRPPPQQLRRYYFADGGKKCRDYDTESPANNFLGIRHVDPAGEFGDSLYAEFQTGVQSARFEVDFSKVDFVEYYNLTADLVRKQAQSCQCVTAASLYPAETLLRMQKRTSF